jgi:DNA repair protein RadC
MWHPEFDLLRAVLGNAPLARRLARAPGGWRTLSGHELAVLGLDKAEQDAVVALQRLTRRSYPELERQTLACSRDIARVYGMRLGGMVREVMIAVALDGQNHFMSEVPIATGGAHGICLKPSDVLRPLIRIGASAFVLVHNHPSTDPTPSREDVEITEALSAAADIVGLPLVDHVVVGARGGGYTSLFDLGLISNTEKSHEQGAADTAVRA